MVDISRLAAYTFDLPKNLIAQTPLAKRDDCRLLVADPQLRQYSDNHFHDLTHLLGPSDVLVINTSRVRRSRLYLQLNHQAIEILLLKRHSQGHWSALGKPGKKIKEGSLLFFAPRALPQKAPLPHSLALRCLGRQNEIFFLRFEQQGKPLSAAAEEAIIENGGDIPLPPYIKKNGDVGDSYQTVYSKKRGSAAAPTAGLHFTEALLKDLGRRGVGIIEVELQIGWGTFQPVRVSNIAEHVMPAEPYVISPAAAELLNQAVRQDKNLYPVGTTSLRALEDNWLRGGIFRPGEFSTNIFIHPPQTVQSVAGLITNFHLPQSTLLMLVAALGGYAFTFDLYRHAIAQKYRFYSFGDALFLKNKI